jgi:hypothetical protein
LYVKPISASVISRLSKVSELETNIKDKNIRDLNRDINDFKQGYQSGTGIVKYEDVQLATDCHSILPKW